MPTIITAFGTQDKETSISGRNEGARYSVNFYGTLDTDTDHSYQVDSITFNKLIKDIPVYAMPGKDMWEPLNGQTKKLKVNPSSSANGKGKRIEISYIDLAEESTIAVPNPSEVWVYNEKPFKTENDCCSQEMINSLLRDSKSLLYSEIVITNKTGKPTHYLVEQTNNLYLNEVTDAGPKRMTVPIPAVKKLTIEGYKKRDSDEENDNAKKRTITQASNHRGKLSKKLRTASAHSRNNKQEKIIKV